MYYTHEETKKIYEERKAAFFDEFSIKKIEDEEDLEKIRNKYQYLHTKYGAKLIDHTDFGLMNNTLVIISQPYPKNIKQDLYNDIILEKDFEFWFYPEKGYYYRNVCNLILIKLHNI